MPLETQPALSTARSHQTHSTRVLDSTETQSPGRTPRAASPMASSRTMPPPSRQLQPRQMQKSFCRISTRSPRAATPFQNMAWIVSPGTVASGRGWKESSFQRLGLVMLGSPPGFLFLPAPLAARTVFLHAEVELLDVVLLAQP